VVLLRLRLARQNHLRNRLQVAIAEAAEATQAGAIVVVEDSRIRIDECRLQVERSGAICSLFKTI
jgi:tRNA/tmRNA/rRNA uracil-C5-methylase (TrmA/RlmC/RlmD family)